MRRRTFLKAGLLAAGFAGGIAQAEVDGGRRGKFPLAFNTATIMGYHLPVEKQVDWVSRIGGFSAIEPWHRDLRDFKERGGSFAALKRQLDDAGLKICGLIAFPFWAANDAAKRREGQDMIREELDWVRELGGAEVAAPVLGCFDAVPSLDVLADRYREVCKIAAQREGRAALEIWGPIPICSTLAEAQYVTSAAEMPNASLLLDAYHLYRGAGLAAYESLKLVAGNRMTNFHLNDYPAGDYTKLSDGDRVLPGDGVAPLRAIQETLWENGYRGYLSLEIFNKKFWETHSIDDFMRLCRQKMDAAVLTYE
ncbi:MAG: sugar phosphate isomerase/epimerase family protein [Planctomycetia bacterium]|nr:sugar phosphate isomerase/epimerase family protein [Planctomycetia bacterium]